MTGRPTLGWEPLSSDWTPSVPLCALLSAPPSMPPSASPPKASTSSSGIGGSQSIDSSVQACGGLFPVAASKKRMAAASHHSSTPPWSAPLDCSTARLLDWFAAVEAGVERGHCSALGTPACGRSATSVPLRLTVTAAGWDFDGGLALASLKSNGPRRNSSRRLAGTLLSAVIGSVSIAHTGCSVGVWGSRTISREPSRWLAPSWASARSGDLGLFRIGEWELPPGC
eukprot:336059-Prorocentrum_minimum.AAC.3